MSGTPVSVIAVDWGTSHLRIWPLDAQGRPNDCLRSKDGMRNVEKDAFAGVLDNHLSTLNVSADIPVLMCGMVGARQGWQEAPYIAVPCGIADCAKGAIAIDDTGRDIRILPGLANYSLQSADVMRSEETQLLGLSDRLGGALDGLVCMPGTHSKWVRIKDGGVEDFFTSLSGELFAALGAASVLKHAIGDAKDNFDATCAAFVEGTRKSLDEPATILNRLFSARPKSLLLNMSNDDAAAFISGTIIGQDIAGAKSRFPGINAVTLVGSGHLGALYSTVLELAGLEVRTVDGDELAVAGLAHAARLIWPDRFEAI